MLLNDYIIVEKVDKIGQGVASDGGPFLNTTVISNNLGVIVDCADEYPLSVGDKVYFLNQYEPAVYENRNVLVMKKANIFKVLKDGTE